MLCKDTLVSLLKNTESTIRQLCIKLNIVASTQHREKSELPLCFKHFQQKIYYNYYTELDQQQFNL